MHSFRFMIRAVFLAGLFVVAPIPGAAAEGHGAPGKDLPGAEVTKVPEPQAAPDIVVSIDGSSYSREDVRLYAEFIVGEDPSGDAALGKYIDQMVLDHVAYDEGVAEYPEIPGDPEVRTAVRRFLGRALVPRLLAGVRDGVDPQVDDIAKTLPDRKAVYEVAIIVCQDREKLLQAEKELGEGVPFAEVAIRHSDGLTSHKGGIVPPFEEGDTKLFTPEEFGRFATLEDGAVSKPFQTRVGWAVVKLVRRVSPEEQKREEATRNLAAYRDRMKQEAVDRFTVSTREKADIRVSGDVVAGVRETLAGGKPFPKELRSAELARVNGVPLYGFEIDQMRGQHSVGDIETFLERRIGEEALLQEALARFGQADAARYARIAEKRYVTREYFRRKRDSFRPSAEELEAFYKDNPGIYTTREVRRLRVIQNARRSKVEEAIRRAKKGESFPALAARLNEGKEQRAAKGDVGFVPKSALKGEIGEAVYSAKAGSVLGPFEVKDPEGKVYFIAVKVEEVVGPKPIPYERVEKTLLADRYVSRKMEEFHRSFLKKAAENHSIRVFLKNPEKGAGGYGAIGVGGEDVPA